MGNLSNLPSEIILDIITRLPTESILDCKLVCRPWRYLVSHHPSFSQMHLTRLRDLDSGKLSFLVLNQSQDLYYFEYNDETPTDCIRRIKFTPPFETYYYALGSFNGIVCFHGWHDCDYCICNPVTKEYVLLPKIKTECEDKMYFSSGFGYLPLTNEYKVVELYTLRSQHNIIEAVIYTLGDGNGWRIAGRLEFAFPSYAQPGVYVNGSLHFKDKEKTKVLVFDLTEEKFLEHLLPPPLPQDDMCQDYTNTIGDLGGVLYYAINFLLDGDICSDIWLLKEKNDDLDMKQQVEHEPLGWRKEFSRLKTDPFAFTKSGGILCFDDSSLSFYDAIASTSRKLLEFTACRQIFPHKNILVSLKELGEEDIKLMESVEIEEIENRDPTKKQQPRWDL